MNNANGLLNKLSESYRKNKTDIKALLFGNYPEFIYRRINTLPKGDIPVFTFHSVKYQKLEQQLKYLAENGYKTLNAEQFYEIIIGKILPEENTVVLTFDDGLTNLWTIAYPLLKKYSFCGISFLIPSVLREESKQSPTLEDVWLGKVSKEELEEHELACPVCNWCEIKEMHNSGVIDFQSHTFYHKSVYISDKLVDFVNPEFQPSFLIHDFNHVITNYNSPENEKVIEYGYPVYKWDSNMSALTRFIENEQLIKICVEYVKRNGGEAFFQKKHWRKELKKNYNRVKKQFISTGKFQSLDERIDEIKKDLETSKKIIEIKLEKPVEHLCYPWYKAGELAVVASKEAGYKSNYWGIIGEKSINHPGDNPYYISRIVEDYLFTLPGKGRQQLLDMLNNKIKSNLIHTTKSNNDIFI